MNVEVLGEDVVYGTGSFMQAVNAGIPKVKAYAQAGVYDPYARSPVTDHSYNPIMAAAQMAGRRKKPFNKASGFLSRIRPGPGSQGFMAKFRRTSIPVTPMTTAMKKAAMMRRSGYGDDIMYDGWLEDASKSISGFFQSDTGKVVTQAVATSVGQRLTPTQKAQWANIQEAAGISPYPVNPQTGMQNPNAFDYQKNMPYLIAGGAVLIGLIMILGTRKSRDGITA